MDQTQFSSFLDDWISKHSDELIAFLLELIAVPSTEQSAEEGAPFGPDIAKAFELYLNKAESFGMSVKNIDGYAVHAEIGSGEEMAMTLTHADIVPIGTGWTKNPYGEVSEGNIYGRGSQDNKGPTAASLYAMKAIKDSGATLKRRIRHVVGGNEESGFRCVRHYFTVEELPTYGFSPDGMFPLVYAEKGSMNVKVTVVLDEGPYSLLKVTGGERANIVPERSTALLKVPAGSELLIIDELKAGIAAVKELVGGPGPLSFGFTPKDGEVAISCVGKACHASVPSEGTNAVTAVLHLVTSLGDKLSSSPYVKFASDAGDIYGKGLNIDSEDDISGKLSCNLGVCRTDEVDGKRVLTAIYNIRYPVKISGEELKHRALNCDRPETDQIAVEVMSLSKSHYTDPESFLVKELLRVYREETGDNSPPITIGGGTYARVIPGGVAFGPVLPGTTETAHQANEFLPIETLLLLVKIYARSLYALAR